MLNHLLHRAVLQELAVLIAVLAVVKVRAPVSIRAAILILSERHATTLAKPWKLTRQQGFHLLGECRFIGLKGLGVLVGDKVALGRAVGCLGDALAFQSAGDEFLSEEIRHLGIAWLGVIMNFQLAGQVEARMAIEIDVTLHAKKTHAKFTRLV